MLKNIRIKSFRGIQHGQIDGFRKFNLLVGPNNSGKSAVLEALYLAGTANRSARLTLPTQRESYDGKVSERDFLGFDPLARTLTRHKHAELPTTTANGHQNALRVDLSSSSVPLPSFDLSWGVRLTKDKPYALGLFSFKPGGGSLSDGPPEPEFWKLARQVIDKQVSAFGPGQVVYCWAADLSYYQSGSAAWIVGGPLASLRHTLFYDVSTTLQHLPMDFFRRMIATVPGWSQKIAHHFGRVFNLDKPFNVQFLPTDQKQQWVQGWIAPADQVALTIDSYGDGARGVFKLLTPLIALSELASAQTPGLFIWEEPELFQNPQSLNRLLAEVAALMKGVPVQLFLATHSLEVVANFVRLVNEGAIAADEMVAIGLSLSDGKLSSSAFDHRDIQDWTEMNLDLRVPSGKVDNPLTYQFRETVNAAHHD